MVTHDPSENGTKVENSGVWVINKQTRRKRPGMQDEITPITTYYICGINVFMAPSIASIIGGRTVSNRGTRFVQPYVDMSQLSAVASLTKFLSTASSLPMFTPATGHTYLPPMPKNPTSGSSLQPTQSSKEATPMPGGSTPLPGTQDTTISSKRDSQQSKPNTGSQGHQMLADSYNLSVRYANEYMDENPIVGEPGSFRLTKSHDSTLTSSMSTNKSSQSLRVPTPSSAPTPAKEVPTPQLKTEDPPVPVRKSTKGAEKSPITAGGKEKKDKKERRKSKVAGSGEGSTPRATTPKATTPKPTTPT